MIEYLYTAGKKSCESEPLKVRLDGIICGQIEKIKGINKGYRYYPKGVNRRDVDSNTYSSVNEVQESLSI